MRIGRALSFSLFCAGAACGRGDNNNGGGNGGGPPPPPVPVDHALAQSRPVTFGAGGFYGFEFLLPSEAQLHFSASETTTDTWNVAVFTPAEWVSYQAGSGNQAYAGAHNNVSRADDTVTLPAGDWFLGFRCDNLIERCMFVFDADAVY